MSNHSNHHHHGSSRSGRLGLGDGATGLVEEAAAVVAELLEEQQEGREDDPPHQQQHNESDDDDEFDDERLDESCDDARLLQRLVPHVPGTFVVLQGMPGDGMANTLHVAPRFTPTTTANANASANATTTTTTTTRNPTTTTTSQPPSFTGVTTAAATTTIELAPSSSLTLGLGIGGMALALSLTASAASAAASATSAALAHSVALAKEEEGEGRRMGEEAGGRLRGGAGRSAAAPEDNDDMDVDDTDDDVDDDSTSSLVMVTTTSAAATRTDTTTTEGIAGDGEDQDRPWPADAGGDGDDGDDDIAGAPSHPADDNDEDNGNDVDRRAIEEWEEECRRREREQHREWFEALGAGQAQDDPNLGRWRSGRNNWWRDRSTGRLIVFDAALVDDGTGALVMRSAVEDSAGTAAAADSETTTTATTAAPVAPTVALLSPGTQVVATQLHTVNAITCRPPIQATNNVGDGDGDGDNNDASHSSTSATAATTTTTTTTTTSLQRNLSQGKPGTIQLLRIESPAVGWVVLSWNGYNFLAPGTQDLYNSVDPWMWRVTCPSGAFVRKGLYLGTQKVAVIPYGHLLAVNRKTVNAQGLSRLRVRCVDPTTGNVVRGWCSEFLNPMSGQRGPILQPIPFPAPAIYRVLLDEGAVVRTGVELSSPAIGSAKKRRLLCATSRCFSEHPQDRCLQRLELAGNGGYVSLRLNKAHPENLLVLERVENYRRFDPDRPGDFHLSWMRRVRLAKEESHRRANPSSNDEPILAQPPASRLSPDVSSVDEDESGEDDSVPQLPPLEAEGAAGAALTVMDDINTVNDDDLLTGLIEMYSPTALQTSSPTSRSPRHRPDGRGTQPAGAASSSLPPGDQQQQDQMGSGGAMTDDGTSSVCLICLCEDRTATLVHGETGHICCCLVCARILKARGDGCPVCRLPIDLVVQHFWA